MSDDERDRSSGRGAPAGVDLPRSGLVNSAEGRTDSSPSALNSADPLRNFSLTVDERIRALTIGVPAWAARKRKIEDDQDRHVKELVETYDALVAKKRSGDQIDVALHAAASARDLTKLNELVSTHNRYYPIEANLPMDRRGNYLVYGHVWRPEESFTPARLVALALAVVARRDGADDDAD